MKKENREPEYEEAIQKEIPFKTNMGVKMFGLKDRSIQECLNCKKPKCNCCPTYEEGQ